MKKSIARQTLGRRLFLEQGVAALAALPASALCAKSFGGLRAGSSPKKVVIVGAGLAGLAAGYELAQRGHDVTVLEAQARAGGRVRTIREPFSGGLYAEAGAQFVPDGHELTMKYAKLFDLPLVPLEASEGDAVYHVRGRRVVVNEQRGKTGWPLELAAGERGLGPNGLMKRYVLPVLEELGDAASNDWPPARLKKYDRMTMAEFLRGRGASPGAVELFRAGYLQINGEGIDSYSALSGLRDLALGHGEKEYRIAGGSDLLPQALAARLAGKIIYGAPVVRIAHGAKGVRVTFLRAGSPQTLAADRLVCAVPFSTLRRVEIAPRFSPDKQRAIERQAYTSVTRVFMQLGRKTWLDANLSGEAYLADPPMMFYPFGHGGSRDIYESFVTGAAARRLGALGERERLSYVLAQARKVLPAVGEHFEGGASKCWDEDEWARGAWAWYRPGESSTLPAHSARAEGRVHFAGEHTSAWPGWMQGAFESGRRAAREVDEARS